MTAIELVVARYRADMNWLRNVPSGLGVTVYDKSSVSLEDAVLLPNIGREAHTYLHYLVARYDSLATLTVFCQGRPFDHAYDFHATLRRLVDTPDEVCDFEPFGHLIDTDTCDGSRLFTTWSKNEDGRGLDMIGFHHALWGSDGPTHYTFRGGAQFAVTRELVHRQPRSFYERALEVSQHFPDAAHCFERSWNLVFGVSNPDMSWLDGRETAYLKPVRPKSAKGQD